FSSFASTATTKTSSLSYTTLFRSEERRPHGHHERHAEQHLRQADDDLRDEDHHRPGRGDGEPLEDAVLPVAGQEGGHVHHAHQRDRKSTRLNSSHVKISYAVFCLK